MKFLAALRFLTIVPLRRPFGDEELQSSLGYFPLVGIFIGCVLAASAQLFYGLLPLSVASALVLAVHIIITGALHLDGFLDTCDGIALRGQTSQKLEAMRDSRAGAFGVIGVSSLLLLKYGSLSAIPEGARTAALVTMAAVGRWAALYAVYAYPYARAEGTGTIFKKGASLQAFLLGTLVTLAASLFLGGAGGLTAMILTWGIVSASAAFLKKSLGGLTGDTYGALIEISEVVVLVMVALLVGNDWLWARP